MLDNEFKKSAMEKATTMSANELKKAFKEIGSQPETNEEWIKQCNTEQLAEFLYDIAYFDNWSDAIMNDSLINETAVEYAIEKWLKQPHTFK